MEFWGVEVKRGVPFKVRPEENKLVHVSQAALGEVKNIKGAENVPLRLSIDGSEFVLGTLSAVTRPQIVFDLVFEKEFIISHDWKEGSVFLCGYKADNPYADEGLDEDEFDSEEEDDIPLALENGKVESKVGKGKHAKSTPALVKPESSKKQIAAVDPKEDSDDSDNDSDDEDESDDALELGSDDMSEDDESDDESESDEETPKKLIPNKKRPAESVVKTPVSTKKAKAETPQKTATPHPSKKATEKTPASKKGKDQQSPKSAANVKCDSCSKMFGSEGGRDAHIKAKHSAAK